MTTVAEHINEFIQEYADTTPAKPRNVKLDTFAAIEKAGARARKLNPDAPDFRKPRAVIEIRSLPKGIYVDPRKRIEMNDLDGLGW